MAKKKSRVPVPPRPKSRGTTAPPRRPVQAPKVRTKDRQLRRPPALMYVLAGSGIAALAAVVFVIVFVLSGGGGGGSEVNVATAMRAAGCTYTEKKPLPFTSNHSLVPTLSTPVRWTTFPPAAGEHYGKPAIWDFYRGPANPRQVVHNEEHGGVILWYGPKTPKATVDELERFYQQEPDSMLGTELAAKNPGVTFVGMHNPTLGRKVAITAWSIDSYRNYFRNGNYGIGVSAVCPTFNEQAFTTFRDAHRGNGPEFPKNYSLQLNKPGT
jgi:hypothetical protein